MAGSVVIIKSVNPVIIDTGFPVLGISTIKRAFIKHRVDNNSVSWILVTHSHPDHSMNLFRLKKLCKNAKVICHQNELHDIQNVAQVSRSFKQNFDMADSRFLNLVNRFLGPFSRFFIFILTFYPRIDYLITQDFKDEEFSLKKCPKIKAGDKVLTIIPTIGHSVGHISIYSEGNLFLGDFVPFTPWINPEAQALDDIIQSIKNILTIDNEVNVKLAVRSHGDIRRSGHWEISQWADEKHRFKIFLDTINNSLQKIPKILKDKPLNIQEITKKLRPKKKKYSTLLERFSFKPNLTWTLAYCLKLEKMQIIKRILIDRKLFWTIV
jgi:glyoxylase-like metal-dependent hydrolase (beta-lactamase superfamily II)